MMEFMQFWIIVVGVLTIIVNVTFAVAVYRDAKRIGIPILVESRIWLIATLIGGIVTAAIYWVLHHSRLNPSIPGTTAESEKEKIL